MPLHPPLTNLSVFYPIHALTPTPLYESTNSTLATLDSSSFTLDSSSFIEKADEPYTHTGCTVADYASKAILGIGTEASLLGYNHIGLPTIAAGAISQLITNKVCKQLSVGASLIGSTKEALQNAASTALILGARYTRNSMNAKNHEDPRVTQQNLLVTQARKALREIPPDQKAFSGGTAAAKKTAKRAMLQYNLALAERRAKQNKIIKAGEDVIAKLQGDVQQLRGWGNALIGVFAIANLALRAHVDTPTFPEPEKWFDLLIKATRTSGLTRELTSKADSLRDQVLSLSKYELEVKAARGGYACRLNNKKVKNIENNIITLRHRLNEKSEELSENEEALLAEIGIDFELGKSGMHIFKSLDKVENLNAALKEIVNYYERILAC